MKTNYQVTIGYKAIITIDVKAANETEAKAIAVDLMKKSKEKMFNRQSVILQDDNFKVDGILNMDETWNQF